MLSGIQQKTNLTSDNDVLSNFKKAQNYRIATTFSDTLLGEFKNVFETESSVAQIRAKSRESQMRVEQLLNEYTQSDLSKAMLAGIDLNTGSIESLVSGRYQLAQEEEMRIRNQERKAVDLANHKSILNGLGLLLGASLGFLFL